MGDDWQVITSEIDEGIDERTYQVVPGAWAPKMIVTACLSTQLCLFC